MGLNEGNKHQNPQQQVKKIQEEQNRNQTTATTPTMPESNNVNAYEALLGKPEDQAWNKSPEQLATEKKRERAKRIIGAVSDGISAIANMGATINYAPNAYDGKNTMSGKMKERYDKMLADREAAKQAYVKDWMGARMQDLANNWKIYSATQSQANWDKQFNYREEQDRLNREERKSAQKQSQANFESQMKQSAEIAKEGNASRERIAAQQSSDRRFVLEQKARGNKIPIYDKMNNKVYDIYETVWENNYATLYNDLVAEYKEALTSGQRSMIERPPRNANKTQMEVYVRRNWQVSERAKANMEALSKIDPANPQPPKTDTKKPYNPDNDNKTIL